MTTPTSSRPHPVGRFFLRALAAFLAAEISGICLTCLVFMLPAFLGTPDLDALGMLPLIAIYGVAITSIPALPYALICAALSRRFGWIVCIGVSAFVTSAPFFIAAQTELGELLDFAGDRTMFFYIALVSGAAGMAAAKGLQSRWDQRDAERDEQRSV